MNETIKDLASIPVNIWNDYADGDVTYMYVEECEVITDKEKEVILKKVALALNKEFKNVVFTFNKDKVQMDVENLSHKTWEKLYSKLNGFKLKYKHTPIDIYSES